MDRRAWALKRLGKNEEEIGAILGISVVDVRYAVMAMELYQQTAVSNEIVGMKVNEEVLSGLEGTGEFLREARDAETYTGAIDKHGNPIFARDWATGLAAVGKLTDLAAATVPRGGSGITVNTAIQNNMPGNGSSTNRSFEAMVRDAEKRQRVEAGSGVAAPGSSIIDAEVEDAGPPSQSSAEPELDDPDEVDEDEEDYPVQ